MNHSNHVQKFVVTKNSREDIFYLFSLGTVDEILIGLRRGLPESGAKSGDNNARKTDL